MRHEVTVDLNDLRKEAVLAYARLVTKMNDSIRTSAREYGDNTVRVDPDYIQEDMDDLRTLLVAMAFAHGPTTGVFRNVYCEAFPGGKGPDTFNDMDEDHEEAK